MRLTIDLLRTLDFAKVSVFLFFFFFFLAQTTEKPTRLTLKKTLRQSTKKKMCQVRYHERHSLGTFVGIIIIDQKRFRPDRTIEN